MSVYKYLCRKSLNLQLKQIHLSVGIKSALGLENLTGLRVINRYDAEGLSERISTLQRPVVFSEPAVDVTYDHLPAVKLTSLFSAAISPWSARSES